MTIGILHFKEIDALTSGEKVNLDSLVVSSAEGVEKRAPLSGKELAARLAGLLTDEEADELERNINEGCEQVDG